jgi:hypothetical protein
MKRILIFTGMFVVGITATLLLAENVFTPAVQRWTSIKDEHLAFSDAKGQIPLDLPADASDIRFYQHTFPDQVVAADFAISETSFLEWAKRLSWNPKPIQGSITVWPRSAFGDKVTEVQITNGLFDTNDSRGQRNVFSLVYDRAHQRAHYGFRSEARED